MGLTKKEKFIKETNDLYRAYGRFAVEFEHLIHNVRLCLIFMMRSNNSKNQELVRILLADQTARPLIDKLKAFVSIRFDKQADEITHVHKLLDFCISLTEKRNEIIHGTWYIGWESTGPNKYLGSGKANSHKDKLTKKGIDFRTGAYESKDLDDLTEKVIKAKDFVYILLPCILDNASPIKNIDKFELSKLKL